MLLRILIPLVCTGIGFLFIWRTDWVIDFTGRWGWAERKLGPTGTYTVVKFVGVLIIFIGYGYATNFIQTVMYAPLKVLFGGFAPSDSNEATPPPFI